MAARHTLGSNSISPVLLLASGGGVDTGYFGHSSFVRIHVLSGL